MVFFTPDLESYRDEIRGFSIDYEATVPGPVLRTADEVVDAMRSPAALEQAYAERYRNFLATYCARDDGEAAVRVVDAVFGG
jgi:CDP-glycerol glycerophosphotransferase